MTFFCIRNVAMTTTLLFVICLFSTDALIPVAVPPTTAINSPRPALPLKALSLDSDFGVGGELNLLHHYKATSQPQDHRSINNRHSAGDWLYNVFSLPKSSVLKEIRSPVLTIAAWSGVVSVIHRTLQQQTQSTLCQRLARNMCIGATPHSFLVSSLGLLLVFRTNSAYQRFNVSTIYTYICMLLFPTLNLACVAGGTQDLGKHFEHFAQHFPDHIVVRSGGGSGAQTTHCESGGGLSLSVASSHSSGLFVRERNGTAGYTGPGSALVAGTQH